MKYIRFKGITPLVTALSLSTSVALASPDLDQFKTTWKYQALELQRDLTKQYGSSKRFNIKTHNSFNTAMYKNSVLSVAYSDPQQVLTITGQLDAGVRHVNIDAHYAHGDVRMCHWGGPSGLSPLFCSPSDKSFKDGIGEIATWLLRPENQNEVVSLYIQNEVKNEAGYRIAANALQAYEDLIYVPGGDGSKPTAIHVNPGHMSIGQEQSLGSQRHTRFDDSAAIADNRNLADDDLQYNRHSSGVANNLRLLLLQ